MKELNAVAPMERVKKKKRRPGERAIESAMLLCALLSVAAVVLITVLIFSEGLPIFSRVSVWDFISGTKWKPTQDIYGIFPMIVGSLYTTAIALLIGIPIGLGCAIFLAEIAPRRVAAVLRRGIEILAGIPSVVFGFFGMVMLVPFIRTFKLGPGFSVLAAGLILAVMILPTIISISEVSLRAVPKSYRDGSLAMGASKWQTIRKVSLPTAKSGIITSIVLGIGRAVGETMAVRLVAGNTPIIPESIFQAVRTMTVNIVIEMSYVVTGSDHYAALFATGIVLFVFIMILNGLVTMLSRKRVNSL
jgi:phosphate ABC transporter, permease protein PstA/phosphate ABC transporter, permease protein PstC